jgi:hypothetical protein
MSDRGNTYIQVSQEECARLREGVPYGKIYWNNPKYLCPKLNGYGDGPSGAHGWIDVMVQTYRWDRGSLPDGAGWKTVNMSEELVWDDGGGVEAPRLFLTNFSLRNFHTLWPLYSTVINNSSFTSLSNPKHELWCSWRGFFHSWCDVFLKASTPGNDTERSGSKNFCLLRFSLDALSASYRVCRRWDRRLTVLLLSLREGHVLCSLCLPSSSLLAFLTDTDYTRRAAVGPNLECRRCYLP